MDSLDCGVGAAVAGRYRCDGVSPGGALRPHPLPLSQATLFKLPSGSGRDKLQALLIRDRLIHSGRYLPWLLQLEPDLAQFKAGTYRLTPGMTVRDMLALFSSGREAQFDVRFIEGTRFSDWLKVLADAPQVRQTLRGESEAQIAQRLGITAGQSLEGGYTPTPTAIPPVPAI